MEGIGNLQPLNPSFTSPQHNMIHIYNRAPYFQHYLLQTNPHATLPRHKHIINNPRHQQEDGQLPKWDIKAYQGK